MILICLSVFFLILFAGLLSWNASNCHVNLEEELNTITIQALDGEEGKNGKWKSCGTQQISLTDLQSSLINNISTTNTQQQKH